ncbi:MAG: hypothetical protein COA79_05800 [Planctomycetota bacterium]|nr:MAG: hypothetical protein COA79_05800 [Planctomycetota bacterium]
MGFKRSILVSSVMTTVMIFISLGTYLHFDLVSKKSILSETEEYNAALGTLFSTVNKFYVEPINKKKLFEKVAEELVNLDENSHYLNSKRYKSLDNRLEGEYQQLGITYRRKGEFLLITNVNPDGPAANKLKYHDKIEKINDLMVNENRLSVIRKSLNSKSSNISFEITRPGEKQKIKLSLNKKVIMEKPIRMTHLIRDGIGFMKIDFFSKFTVNEFKKKYLGLLKKHPAIKGMILDMRGNPGGTLPSAIHFCDLFLDEGLIVATVGNEEGRRNVAKLYKAKKGKLPIVPFIIMLDRDSASAAELSTNCLRDYGLAKVIGERSYGKGTAQTVFDFESKNLGKYGMRLTTNIYYTKVGYYKSPRVSINNRGVDVDIKHDFGNQDSYMARKYNFNEAVGQWNNGIINKLDIAQIAKENFYFSDLKKYDPAILKAIEYFNQKATK